jgi:hypothetical protein
MNTNQKMRGHAASSWRQEICRTLGRLAVFWPFLLPLVIYLPGILGWIPFPSPEAEYSDLLLTHYPYSLFLKESLLVNQALPLWNPHLMSGFPFAANPLSGLFYPGGWPALFFPLPAGLSVMAAAHILWGEIGSYRYLRSIGVSHTQALIGGLIFGFLPKFASHYGAGHITLIYAVSWTPWLLVHRKGPQGWLQDGAVLALIFLADPRWTAYSGAVWLAYRAVHHQGGISRFIVRAAKTTGFALLGAAPLLLPMGEFVSRSSRISLESSDVFAFSLPPAGIPGLFFPKGGGNPEWELYLGAVGLMAAWLGWLVKDKNTTHRFWLGAMVFSLIWSFGDHLPFLKWASVLPGINLLRVPPRALFITGLAASVVGALTGKAFLEGRLDLKKSRLAAAGVITAGFITIAGMLFLTGTLQLNLLVGWTSLALTAVLVFSIFSSKMPRSRAAWLLVALIAADGLTAGLINYQPRELPVQNGLSSRIEGAVMRGEQMFRIYSPSAGIPQYLAVEEEYYLAHGVDPLQLQQYREVFLEAAGVVDQGYDVSVPPYYGEHPETAHRFAEPSAELLGLFNVLLIESKFPLEEQSQLREIDQSGTSRLYQNLAFQPRAWTAEISAADLQTLDMSEDLERKQAEIVEYLPNRIRVNAKGPGTLVLSEINYPGWTAAIDGRRVPVRTAGTIFRAVELEAGDHQVLFRFRPLSVYAGIFGGLTAAGLYVIWRRRYAAPH